ncbi:glycosyltransferase [Metabacillus sp. cB07]|uniref:glycosyltransferase n=1 Tax=Metabacillus sp. cB07 TaxID=2806989 RepID=UPI001F5DD372|nr:glycosyltransferase [Metabacillus sp. cB07]
MEKPLVSIIMPVKNEGIHIKNTIESALNSKTNCPFEIIVVDDLSDDGCCSFLGQSRESRIKLVRTSGLGAANARNAGADAANGEIFIFCDAHVFFEHDWLEKLIEPLLLGTADAVNPGIGDSKRPARVGYGITWNKQLDIEWRKEGKDGPFPSPLLAGGCLAVTRAAFEDIDGFERGFQVWGREDEEISLKLWLFGYRCYIVPSVKVLHVFRQSSPPFKLSWNHVNYNLLRMAHLHFSKERIEKCRKLVKFSQEDKLMAMLEKSDIDLKRALYEKKRKYDDDWYMEKFNIPF